MKAASDQVKRHRITPWMHAALITVVALALAWVPAQAQTVAVDVGDGAGTVGDTVIGPSTVDAVTGLGILAYEIEITWTANRASVTAASEAGTLSAPWGAVTVNAGSGFVNIAAAGATTLNGAGTLINLEFLLGPLSGNTTLTLQSALFNEGSPSATLTNGLLTIAALPTISVTPNTGEILVGQNLAFSTTGGTPPYSYASSDPLIADFSGDTLTGLSPGSVRVTSEDFNGVTDETSGFIDIRALRIDAGDGAGVPGNVVSIPLDITDPSPYAITSAELTLTYPAAHLRAVGIGVTGTLVETAGWATPAINIGAGTVTMSMAGVNPLPAAGTLINVFFLLVGQSTINAVVTPASALFNETLPAATATGQLSITGFPTLSIAPDLPQLVAGDLQSFSVSGGATLPLTWGVTNGGAASIDGAGLLTALAAGQTRVWVQDAIGATDTTSTFTICDLYVDVIGNVLSLITPRPVHIQPDRDVTGMGIYGYEMTVGYDPNRVIIDSITSTGTLSQSWGQPVVNLNTPGTAIIVHAGATALAGVGPLITLNLLSTSQLLNASSTVSIPELLFNEGDPCARLNSGTVSNPTAAPPFSGRTLNLEQNIPNPFNPRTEIAYEITSPGQVRLRIYDAAGSLVRTLLDGREEAAGRQVVTWNGTDDAGHRLASGIYFYRLEAANQVEVRKMVLVK
jgi:hypothetical protein